MFISIDRKRDKAQKPKNGNYREEHWCPVFHPLGEQFCLTEPATNRAWQPPVAALLHLQMFDAIGASPPI